MQKLSSADSRVRVATLEMAILVLKQLIGVGSSSRRKHTSCLRDHHLAALEGAREEATLILRNFYKVNLLGKKEFCFYLYFLAVPYVMHFGG